MPNENTAQNVAWWHNLPAIGSIIHVKSSGKRHGYNAVVLRHEKRGFEVLQPGMVVETNGREVWVRLGETEALNV